MVKAKSMVDGIEKTPDKRGLTEAEISGTWPSQQPKPPDDETHFVIPAADSPKATSKAPELITEIISFQAGELVVKKSDGKTYRRAGGTISWRQHNVGNLKYGPFAKTHKAVGEGHGGHAVFATAKDGKEAQHALLFTDAGDYQQRSIAKAIAKYAPANDPEAKNDPNRYAVYVASKVGVSKDTLLSALTVSQQEKLVEAMSFYEGYSVGTEVEV